MIQYQILQFSIMRIIQQTVKRISKKILGVKGFNIHLKNGLQEPELNKN